MESAEWSLTANNMITPYYGVRRMKVHLNSLGFTVSRELVARYYNEMRITAIYPKPSLTTRFGARTLPTRYQQAIAPITTYCMN